MSVVDELLEKISKLTLVEASELVKKMEEKFGISTAAPVAVAAAVAPQAGGAAQPAEEAPAAFNLVLKSVGEKKVDVIKIVREITGLGLKEAKELVEKGNQVVKEGLDKNQAEELKKKFTDVGATVELVPA
ncbi:MAG: 50S ribosomal protein L7/L12 [Leptospiraceae bacterium]|nr:50S ribosomal protein L7/L12 [Leptospiraceae bacterium]MDW7975163.1 50S ribosomal protein L7/L12 [Leptospiraceae bacterium]